MAVDYKNHPVIKLFLILVFFIITGRISNSAGFCATQMRFISDEEYIEMMLEYPYKNTIKLTSADTSVKAYIKNHPSCCNIKATFILDLLDRSARKVYISYPVRAKATDNRRGESFYKEYFYLEHLSISACGEKLESAGFGQRTPFSDIFY